MKNNKKAIGYVCEIPIPDTDLVISREYQRDRIRQYAGKENMELVAIYEDEEFTENFIDRPGIRKIIESDAGFDTVLVERVWCMSRKIKELNPFLDKLDRMGVELVATSYLWDCTSQQVRHRYFTDKLRKMKEEAKEIKEAA